MLGMSMHATVCLREECTDSTLTMTLQRPLQSAVRLQAHLALILPYKPYGCFLLARVVNDIG